MRNAILGNDLKAQFFRCLLILVNFYHQLINFRADSPKEMKRSKLYLWWVVN